jgi:hypothetical protein
MAGLRAFPEAVANWQAVLFKHDHMYGHGIMRINFTTYDVHRNDDIIHSGTHAQSNVMVLNPHYSDPLHSGTDNHHLFWYAHILGVYHANVIYIGEGNTDYSPPGLISYGCAGTSLQMIMQDGDLDGWILFHSH